ncbi:MAG: hypothetical protein HY023_03155, partial [Chloroflexi bacterium]|nr:hypothetical protein [Chloroflexota bacterium]
MALIGLAVGLGLAAARLPLGPAMAVTLGPALLALIFIEPAVGLGLTLIAAPLKAYLARVYPGLPLDPGQLFFAVTLAAWLARNVVRREIKIPHLPSSACPRAVSGVFLSLTLFISISALSLWAAPSLSDGFGELIKWAQIGLMAALVFDCGRRNRALAFILGAVFAAGAIQAGLGLWQFAFSANEPAHFRILGDHFRAFGTFEQPNPFGGFMGLLWPVAAGLTAWTVERRVWSDSRFTLHASHSTLLALLTSLFLLSLALSFSRGAWLGAAAAGVTLLAFLPRRLWLGLGLVTVALIGGLWLAERGLLPQAITARIADLGD